MPDKTTLIVHSGEMDKLYSALIIANGSLSMGMDAVIYFTFWGLLRLTVNGLEKGQLSSMNMFGIGKFFVKKRMKKTNVADLERLLSDYKELGGKIIACEMTMEIMGLEKKDLREDLIDDYGAVGSYIQEARNSNITLLI